MDHSGKTHSFIASILFIGCENGRPIWPPKQCDARKSEGIQKRSKISVRRASSTAITLIHKDLAAMLFPISAVIADQKRPRKWLVWGQF
jgi:hypothetical protein